MLTRKYARGKASTASTAAISLFSSVVHDQADVEAVDGRLSVLIPITSSPRRRGGG